MKYLALIKKNIAESCGIHFRYSKNLLNIAFKFPHRNKWMTIQDLFPVTQDHVPSLIHF